MDPAQGPFDDFARALVVDAAGQGPQEIGCEVRTEMARRGLGRAEATAVFRRTVAALLGEVPLRFFVSERHRVALRPIAPEAIGAEILYPPLRGDGGPFVYVALAEGPQAREAANAFLARHGLPSWLVMGR